MLRRMQDRHCTDCSLSHQNALPRSHRIEAMPVVDDTLQLISTCTKPRETSIVALGVLNRRPSPHCLLAVAFANNKTCSFAVYPYLRSQRLARLGLSSCPFVAITTHQIRAFYPYLRPTRHTRLGLSSCPSVAFVANEIGVDKVSRQLFTHEKSKQVHS